MFTNPANGIIFYLLYFKYINILALRFIFYIGLWTRLNKISRPVAIMWRIRPKHRKRKSIKSTTKQ